MNTIDARGLSCPEPVIMIKDAMATKEAAYEIIVDNTTSKENVTRYAEHQGYQVTVTEKDGEYTLSITERSGEQLSPPLKNMNYIATFYSHFGAMRYKKMCDDLNISAKLMPVPRSLSSSCGTCVRYESNAFNCVAIHDDEIEQIAEETDSGYCILYPN